jgi:hypothetical protein
MIALNLAGGRQRRTDYLRLMPMIFPTLHRSVRVDLPLLNRGMFSICDAIKDISPFGPRLNGVWTKQTFVRYDLLDALVRWPRRTIGAVFRIGKRKRCYPIL